MVGWATQLLRAAGILPTPKQCPKEDLTLSKQKSQMLGMAIDQSIGKIDKYSTHLSAIIEEQIEEADEATRTLHALVKSIDEKSKRDH